jgi:hypothetical protein
MRSPIRSASGLAVRATPRSAGMALRASRQPAAPRRIPPRRHQFSPTRPPAVEEGAWRPPRLPPEPGDPWRGRGSSSGRCGNAGDHGPGAPGSRGGVRHRPHAAAPPGGRTTDPGTRAWRGGRRGAGGGRERVAAHRQRAVLDCRRRLDMDGHHAAWVRAGSVKGVFFLDARHGWVVRARPAAGGRARLRPAPPPTAAGRGPPPRWTSRAGSTPTPNPRTSTSPTRGTAGSRPTSPRSAVPGWGPVPHNRRRGQLTASADTHQRPGRLHGPRTGWLVCDGQPGTRPAEQFYVTADGGRGWRPRTPHPAGRVPARPGPPT